MPNSRSIASACRVETHFTYISATASITARTERQPRSSDCGKNGSAPWPAVLGTATFTVPAGVSIRLDL